MRSTKHPARPTGEKIDVKALVVRNAKRRPVLMAALALAGCATTTQPVEPAGALASARVTYTSVCGEVLRLRNAGRPLPAAIDACVKADDVLDTTELAAKAGSLADMTSGTQRALLLIGAAQAVLIASNGSVR